MEPQQAAVAAHQEGYASEQVMGRTALLHVRVTAQTPQLLVLLRGSGGLMGTIPEIARDLCSCSSEGVSLSMGVSLL